MNKKDLNKGLNNTLSFLKRRDVQIVLTAIILILIIIFSSAMRLQNLPLLKDETTGEYIPLALDPFYFLRAAETIQEQDSLPEFDSLRYTPEGHGWTNEILPQVLVGMTKFANVFGDFSLQQIDILYPVIFFILSLIAFFFFVYSLTHSKICSLISSLFLAFIPSFLYRTMAGFSDHEVLGIFGFFVSCIFFIWGLKFLEEKKSLKKIIGLSILTGFLTTLSTFSWGGISAFIFSIFPLSFFLFWIIKYSEEETSKMKKPLIFYVVWVVSGILFSNLFNYSSISFIKRFFLSSFGIIGLFTFVFIILDFGLCYFYEKWKKKNGKFRQIYSIIITLILGVLLLSIIGQNPFELVLEIYKQLVHPFGTERVGLTVAENTQPYLTDWIGQVGKVFFWPFYISLVFLGMAIFKNIKNKKSKFLVNFFWIFMISGIIFSRISENSLLNGVNFLSTIFYLIPLFIFFAYFFKLYFKEDLNIKYNFIFIISFTLMMVVSSRAAARTFFILSSFMCFSISFMILELFKKYKKNKGELSKMFLGISLIILIIFSFIGFMNFFGTSSYQSKYASPSANSQWQNAMKWVRENTNEGSIFSHWWDYGYWVQYLGERATISDGGRFQGSYRDHLFGRYVLTTPFPETALSFIKSNNITHLLIDSTDLGKYPAYSSIANSKINDRESQISLFLIDDSQTMETKNTTTKIYQGTGIVDEDIIYEEIYFPSEKSYVIGIFIEESKGNIQQPKAVFYYNNYKIYIPVRYLQIENEFFDFGGGLNATIKLIPKISQGSSGGIEIVKEGAAIYLSPRVSSSLFSQIYLLNDPFKKYINLKEIHSEQNPLVSSLNYQGADLGEFIYYNDFLGPIKIWEFQDSEDILYLEELSSRSGDWGEFDNLTFTK